MNMDYNPECLDLKNLNAISKGNSEKMLKYLIQFQKLIPERVELLKSCLEQEDRKGVRQIVHQMSPQLQFFGLKNIVIPIRRLEHEYETMPLEELNTLIQGILHKLDCALKDVMEILKSLE